MFWMEIITSEDLILGVHSHAAPSTKLIWSRLSFFYFAFRPKNVLCHQRIGADTSGCKRSSHRNEEWQGHTYSVQENKHKAILVIHLRSSAYMQTHSRHAHANGVALNRTHTPLSI